MGLVLRTESSVRRSATRLVPMDERVSFVEFGDA